ncbi:MAG: hypothetical protein HYZ68_04030 [Chloroflexi bacterium]|nr:hypothetical protein [Chloroflexota bacterium]
MARPLLLRGAALLIVLGSIVLLSFPAEPSLDPEWVASLARASLTTRQGVRVLHLVGTPEEMGYQHGVLLRDEIRSAIAGLYRETVPNAGYPPFVLARYARWVDAHLPKEYRLEMRGIALGAGVSYSDIVLLNTIEDLTMQPDARAVVYELLTSWDVWVPPLVLPVTRRSEPPPIVAPGRSPGESASFAAFGPATPQGSLVQGIMLEEPWPLERALIAIYEPTVGNAWVGLISPGKVRLLAGLNEEKISMAAIPFSSADASLGGVPAPFLTRLVLERAGDLPQAFQVLASTPRSNGLIAVIGDGKPADAAVMELTAHRQADYLAEEGLIWRGGTARDLDIARLRVKELPEEEIDLEARLAETLRERQGRLDTLPALDIVTALSGLSSSSNGGAILGIAFASSDLELWIDWIGADGARGRTRLDLIEEIQD